MPQTWTHILLLFLLPTIPSPPPFLFEAKQPMAHHWWGLGGFSRKTDLGLVLVYSFNLSGK